MRGQALITGCGLLGRAVGIRLQAEGWAVSFLESEVARVPAGTRATRCDVRERERVERLVRSLRPDVVVHTAALVGEAARRRPREAAEVNIGGTRNVVSAAARVGARLVHVSSLAVYGATLATGPHEEAEPAPRSAYGRTKAKSEQLVLRAVRGGHLRGWVLRLAGLYGPDGGGDRAAALQRLIADTVSGGAEPALPPVLCGRHEYLHADDAARACALALSRDPVSQPLVNIGSGELVDGAGLVATLRRVVPGARVTAGSADDDEGVRAPLDIAKARSVLGYEPAVAFTEGLARLIEHWGQASPSPTRRGQPSSPATPGGPRPRGQPSSPATPGGPGAPR